MKHSADNCKNAPVSKTKYTTTDTHHYGANERPFGSAKEEIGITVNCPNKGYRRDMGNSNGGTDPCPSSN